MRVLLVVLLVGIAGCGGEDNSPDDVAALKKLGALIKQDDQGEVVEVTIINTKITDADLVHLKGMTKLETLSLQFTKITDSGLVHLKGLRLTSLSIPNGAKTELGLKHYLAALETHTALNFGGWKITDAGLVHLKGMTNLQLLMLTSTQVTDAGVAELQKALPNCKIAK